MSAATKKHEVNLGQIISSSVTTPDPQRDAIHIAVAPVVSDVFVSPGQHIVMIDGKACPVDDTIKSVGIVDPFLRHPVPAREKFWLLLHPNTITGLRHEWSHPAFPEVKEPEPYAPQSEAWLRDFANEYYDGQYDAMIERAKAHGIVTLSETDIPYGKEELFWTHFNAVTGRHDPVGEFRCSC